MRVGGTSDKPRISHEVGSLVTLDTVRDAFTKYDAQFVLGESAVSTELTSPSIASGTPGDAAAAAVAAKHFEARRTVAGPDPRESLRRSSFGSLKGATARGAAGWARALGVGSWYGGDSSSEGARSGQQQQTSLSRLLTSLHLQEYERVLDDFGVTQIDDLFEVDEEDLKAIGMKPLHRRRLLAAVASRGRSSSMDPAAVRDLLRSTEAGSGVGNVAAGAGVGAGGGVIGIGGGADSSWLLPGGAAAAAGTPLVGYDDASSTASSTAWSAADHLGIRIDPEELRNRVPIGEGAFGTVYRAAYGEHAVAMKRLKGGQDTAKLVEEAALMARVNGHPHVVHFFGISEEMSSEDGGRGGGSDGGGAAADAADMRGASAAAGRGDAVPSKIMWIVSEYCVHGALSDYTITHTLTTRARLRILSEVAGACVHLHTFGVVHRDISTQNILLASRPDGRPRAKLCDFGLSRQLGDRAVEQQTESRFGPLSHMAPEALMYSVYSRASDVFGFAVTAWEVLASQRAFAAVDATHAALQLVRGVRPSTDALRGLCPEAVADVVVPLIEQCWSAQPHDRPHMADVHRGFERALALFDGEVGPGDP